MSKTVKLYSIIFVLAIVAMLYSESVKKKPINWFPTFTKKHKIPYGTYVLYNLLPDLFPNTKINNTNLPPYQYLKESKRKGAYVFIDEAINFDKVTFKKLLSFVERGNTVFLSTTGCNIDTLGLKTKVLYTKSLDDKPFFKLYSPSYNNKEYSFDRNFTNIVFSKIDTLKTTILGQSGFVNADGERNASGANFIKYKHGNGYFYFHTFPKAFTNYQILDNPFQKYTAGVLSYLGEPEILIWDMYLKSGKSQISSPMHYILANKSLKWAYYLTLLALLVYVLFKGKRKQRSIPVIKPLKNQTLAFTRTIANMYFEKQEHKNIAEHQIQYLLEYIRIKYRIPTYTIDKEFFNTLAARSGNSIESINKLFKNIEIIHNKNQISITELERLNKMIEDLKKQN
jgi:hypothetical protein